MPHHAVKKTDPPSATIQAPDLSSLCLAITEHAPLPMLTVEGAGHVVRYVNPAFCRLLDKSRDELVGKLFREVLPEQDACVALLDRVFRTGTPESHTEQNHSTPHPVFWSYTIWPVIADEHPIGVMIQVTETAQIHEKTLAMNEALILGSVRQHELTEAAEAANARIREADIRKDEFLAMLAHELRNPLAPIRYLLEVVKRAEGNVAVITPALATMERQVRQMTRLIDDLLDVSRISEGKIDLQQTEVELASIIQQAVEGARPACDAAGLALAVTLPQQPLHLYADAARLAQVFGNLLNNACKFSRPGGRISLAAAREGNEMVVTVSDSGIGISPGMLPKIFDMFMQGDQTLERLQSGLGLGLTLVRRLVQMHGGSVEAQSEGTDRGSAFIVRLPALEEKAASPAAGAPAGEPASVTGFRILVVDDNHDAADALAMLLEMTGNQTHLAFDGVAALAAAARVRPDVVLLDIGMPELNGYDVARRIREQPWGRDMVLVALTGWGQDEDRQKTADAGFNEHLVKPVDPARIMKVLAGLAARGAG